MIAKRMCAKDYGLYVFYFNSMKFVCFSKFSLVFNQKHVSASNYCDSCLLYIHWNNGVVLAGAGSPVQNKSC